MIKIIKKLFWFIKFVFKLPFKQPITAVQPVLSKSEPIRPENKKERLESRFLWIINNGHGELQKGKRSPRLENGLIFEEWDYNRIVAKGICDELNRIGIDNILLVPEERVSSFLKGRIDRANLIQSSKPRRYVSIHFNAAPAKRNGWSTAKGIECWHLHGSKVSKRLAETFQRNIVQATGMNDRGTKSKQHKQFYELRCTEMPAVLTENGFYNNRAEVIELMKPETLQRIIDGHVSAILEIENLNHERLLNYAIRQT